jgi:hypothetical protein
MAKLPSYTIEELTTVGLAPAMEFLIAVAQQGGVATYGQLAKHLEVRLKKAVIFPLQIGSVAGELMNIIQRVVPDAPLINLLVVNAQTDQPGDGATGYLRARFGVRGRISKAQRISLVQAGLNEVWTYRGWPELYQRIFRTPLPIAPIDLAEFDNDGQGDNPRFGGFPESEEHKALKQYVLDHPATLKLRLKEPHGNLERRLLSGDEVDVEFVDGSRRIAVEVKSIKSGWHDLQRGIYQCIKYHAVMVAQSGFAAEDADCEAILVSELPLPNDLKALAKRLGVRHRVVRVN